MRRLLAHDLQDHAALPRPVVEVHVDDLLPGAERQLAVDEGHGERRPQQRGAHVAVTVAVAPARIVGIVAIGVRDLIEEAAQVADAAAFVLDGGECAGGGRRKDGHNAGADAAVAEFFGDQTRDVLHVGVAAGLQFQSAGGDGHRISLTVFGARGGYGWHDTSLLRRRSARHYHNGLLGAVKRESRCGSIISPK